MSRPAEESRPAVRAFIAKLSLRRKLYLVFAVALVAVLAPSFVTPLIAGREDAALARLRTVSLPEAESALDLLRTLERVNEGVQLASASADPGALRAFE